MRQAAQGRSVPALSNAQQQRTALDRELAELQKKKLVAFKGGTVTLTTAGYRAIAKRFPRRS